MNRGRHREARRLLERARAEVGDGRVAQLTSTRASRPAWRTCSSETGEHDAAMALCRDVLGRRHDRGQHPRRRCTPSSALLHMLRGETSSRDGRVRPGARDARRARAESPGSTCNRGNVHLQRRHLRAAASRTSRRSFSAYREAGDEYGAGQGGAQPRLHALPGRRPGRRAARPRERAYPAFASEGPVMTAMVEPGPGRGADGGRAARRGRGRARAPPRTPTGAAGSTSAAARPSWPSRAAWCSATPERARPRLAGALRRFRRTGARGLGGARRGHPAAAPRSRPAAPRPALARRGERSGGRARRAGAALGGRAGPHRRRSGPDPARRSRPGP